VSDPCAGRVCAEGDFCDHKDGRCKKNPCDTMTCLPTQACAPGPALCKPDPCQVTVCPQGQGCHVRTDGEAECRIAREVASAGAGCTACVVGARAAGEGRGGSALLLLGVAALVVRRRRTRAG
jgi:hypothetical protein